VLQAGWNWTPPSEISLPWKSSVWGHQQSLVPWSPQTLESPKPFSFPVSSSVHDHHSLTRNNFLYDRSAWSLRASKTFNSLRIMELQSPSVPRKSLLLAERRPRSLQTNWGGPICPSYFYPLPTPCLCERSNEILDRLWRLKLHFVLQYSKIIITIAVQVYAPVLENPPL